MTSEPRKVYMDISIGGQLEGRVIIQLFENTPLAAENFYKLCTGEAGKNSQGITLSYKGNSFHRVVEKFLVQAGDIVCDTEPYPSPNLGKGGASVFNTGSNDEFCYGFFPNEPSSRKHDAKFLVSMANTGKDRNLSQFFINLIPAPHLDGTHVIVGQVVYGKSVVRAIERVKVDAQHVPLPENRVVITDCGQWTSEKGIPVFRAVYEPLHDDYYEMYPEDEENIDVEEKVASKNVYSAALKMKQAGTELFKRPDKEAALGKYRKSLRYVNEYLPDPDQEPEMYAKYMELKKSLHLNISLVALQLQDLDAAIVSASYVLDQPNLTAAERGKALYRRGVARRKAKKLAEALQDLEEAHKEVPGDKAIEKELKECQELLHKKKENEKKKFAKFFA